MTIRTRPIAWLDGRSGGRLRTLVDVFVLTAATAIHAFGQPLPQVPPSSSDRRATAIGVTRNDAPILAYRAPTGGGGQPRLLFVLSVGDGERLTAAATGLIDSIVSGGDDRGAAVVAGVDLARGFPPQAGFYDHPSQPESRYLWRWIGIEAPDLVVEVAAGQGETWFVPESDLPQLRDLAGQLPEARPLAVGDGLVQQLVKDRVANVGAIPAVRVETDGTRFVATLDAALARMRLPKSPARVERDLRLARSPQEIAHQLLEVYGKKLDGVQYIPALALVGRLRQHALDHGAEASPPRIVLEATAPYVDGTKPSIGGPGGGSVYPGHLIFGELAQTTGDRRYVELVLAAANAAFDTDGAPREAMPLHNEMSDAVFMGCPILAQAAGLTAEAKYADACLRNLRFMQKLCLRRDGLYRHSPLDEAAWGRGNGFPALGLCWSLDVLPETSPVREEIATAHRAHLTALLAHQDATGCWHQVIDRPESYREFTATAMITYAMMRGIRAGRLDAATFGPAAERAWKAIAARIAADGSLVDICTGTGKQKTLRDYYDRPAILGRDDRGGAMALLVATERQLHEPLTAADPQQSR